MLPHKTGCRSHNTGCDGDCDCGSGVEEIKVTRRCNWWLVPHGLRVLRNDDGKLPR